MSSLDWLLAAFCVLATATHIFTIALAARRCRPAPATAAAIDGGPSVAILRPVCGLDGYDHVTLRSSFQLDYPNAQLVFCCEQSNDPAVGVVRMLMDEHPHVRAELLIGRNPITCNPKLNNLIKAWPLASADWIIIADSNVLMPQDYVQRLLLAWGPQTGLLCSPPIGEAPAGL